VLTPKALAARLGIAPSGIHGVSGAQRRP
jgi:hypothetical protein